MLKINKENIWVMWPDFLADNFIDYPSNKIFDYRGNFNFLIEFQLSDVVTNKMTLFAKLPTYFGIDIEISGLLAIFNEEGDETKYLTKNYGWEPNKKYKLEITKDGNDIKVTINNELIFDIILKTNLIEDNKPHIIFGSGNFPKNDYNLNYFDGTISYLSIKKDGTLISEHTFEKFIHNKSYDLTNNCNFIHKI
jgi:hypothetical protein